MSRALILLLFLLLAPTFAQEEPDPNAEFVTSVMRCVLTGDGPGAARLITENKPRALESFHLLVTGYAEVTDPKQQQMLKGYVNTVARVFEASGDPSLVERLKAEGLLVEAPRAYSLPDGDRGRVNPLLIGEWR